ncbi:MAG TPA: NAD-dependent epimerase/dehydratase family protein [Acidimicrobiales bacterium]|nr:NAD-dependent epimerase/dehydratase family protein [Acidimicrobiales bacterium]
MPAKLRSVAPSRPARSVLVLGAGFIGSHIVRALLDAGYRVVVLTRDAPHPVAATLVTGARLVLGDAGNAKTLVEALDSVDRIVFALGSLMPGEAEREPLRDLSLLIEPLLTVLARMDDRALPLTFISSGGTVYGNPAVYPTPESAPTLPLSAYGITRLTAERFVLRHAALSGTQVRILRIGNAYGPGQMTNHGQGIVGTVFEHCLTGTPIDLYGDGGVSRDFIHVEDAAAAVAGLIERGDGPDILNVASGTSVSLSQVLKMAEEVSGRRLEIVRRDAREFDVPHVQLDIGALRSLIDFQPRTLLEGMAQTWCELEGRHAAGRSAPLDVPVVS